MMSYKDGNDSTEDKESGGCCRPKRKPSHSADGVSAGASVCHTGSEPDEQAPDDGDMDMINRECDYITRVHGKIETTSERDSEQKEVSPLTGFFFGENPLDNATYTHDPTEPSCKQECCQSYYDAPYNGLYVYYIHVDFLL